jgi:hypothetical protein
MRGGLASATGAAAIAVAIALAAAPWVDRRVDQMDFEAREVRERMELHRDLARAVDAAGGAGTVTAFGPATANRAFHTRLAWELGMSIRDVELGGGRGLVFRSSRKLIAGPLRVWGGAAAAGWSPESAPGGSTDVRASSQFLHRVCRDFTFVSRTKG